MPAMSIAPRLHLVLGGARSGKSRQAESLAAAAGDEIILIATAEGRDEEMRARIAHHRAQRPAHWRTVEEPLALAGALKAHSGEGRCVIVDCLTLWLSNWLDLIGRTPAAGARFAAERGALLAALPALAGTVVLVSNEVGLGVVPLGALTRRFVDEQGRLNQDLAARCERVTWMAAGLPLTLKEDAA